MDALRDKLNDDSAVHALAELCLEVWLGQPVDHLLPRDSMVGAIRNGLDGWLSSGSAVAALTRVVDLAVKELQANTDSVKTAVPAELRTALREVVRRPVSPERRLVLTVIDRGPLRDLVRQVLLDFVLEFGRRASAPVAGVAKGLGTFAKLAGEAVKSRSGTFGSLVGAVGSEVERQMEKRSVEFVDAALSGVFAQIADALSDPTRAHEAAELRVAILDGVLELTLPQLARELANADVPGAAEVLRDGLRRWLSSSNADAQLASLAQVLLNEAGPRKASDVLEELGLLTAIREYGTRTLAARIREVVASAAFEAWATAPAVK